MAKPCLQGPRIVRGVRGLIVLMRSHKTHSSLVPVHSFI